MKPAVCAICGNSHIVDNEKKICDNNDCSIKYEQLSQQARESRKTARMLRLKTDPAYQATPQEIREARELLGLTRDDLAARLGYESDNRQGVIYNWENEVRPIPQEKLPFLYYWLGINPKN